VPFRAHLGKAKKNICAIPWNWPYTEGTEIWLSLNVRDFELVPPKHFRVPLSVASDLLSRKFNTKEKGTTQWNKEQ
jgi:hypothetical protein